MLEVRDVEKRFGAVNAVHGLSFTVREGEIVGFLGPNGAGKTTTMRILAGIFPPTRGEVRIGGHDPLREPLACRRLVGYFPEFAPVYPELTVEGYLDFVARLKHIARAGRREAVHAVLEGCGLTHMARRRIGTLSKGYRQRVGLAQALCGDPPILVLDEPTIGLDPGQVVEIRELVSGLRGARTVLFSSHILSEVETLCERVVVIARGRIVGEGSAADLRNRLGARQRIVLRVDAPGAAVAEALGALDAALHVVADGEAIVVESGADVPLARVVSETVQRHGWVILELRQETLDLEDIFLQLVGRGGEPRA
jgi:ABC-2 type transport system ATP-binding protein